MIDFGDSGVMRTPSGHFKDNLMFIIMEYVPRGDLFDLCETKGAMGENIGRLFFKQLLDAIEYMHEKRVVHLDIKLENILVDKYYNLKLADFGFACYNNFDALDSCLGTK